MACTHCCLLKQSSQHSFQSEKVIIYLSSSTCSFSQVPVFSLETAEDSLSVHLASFLFFSASTTVVSHSQLLCSLGLWCRPLQRACCSPTLPVSLIRHLHVDRYPTTRLVAKEKERREGSPAPLSTTSKDTKMKTWPTSHCPSGKQRCLIKRGSKRGASQKPRPLMCLSKDVTQGRRSSESQHPAFSWPTEGTAGNRGPAFPSLYLV